MKTRLAIAFLALFLFFGCDAFKKAYNEQFVKSWRESFMKGCKGNENTAEQEKLCTCLADRALKDLTVDQLSDAAYTTKYLTDKVMPECQQ